jgi:hypothetical protein
MSCGSGKRGIDLCDLRRSGWSIDLCDLRGSGWSRDCSDGAGIGAISGSISISDNDSTTFGVTIRISTTCLSCGTTEIVARSTFDERRICASGDGVGARFTYGAASRCASDEITVVSCWTATIPARKEKTSEIDDMNITLVGVIG